MTGLFSLNENKGSFLGIIGAVLNCLPSWGAKEIAFMVWIISNSILFLWAIKQEMEGAEVFGKKLPINSIALMYMAFFITSSVGLISHLAAGRF